MFSQGSSAVLHAKALLVLGSCRLVQALRGYSCSINDPTFWIVFGLDGCLHETKHMQQKNDKQCHDGTNRFPRSLLIHEAAKNQDRMGMDIGHPLGKSLWRRDCSGGQPEGTGGGKNYPSAVKSQPACIGDTQSGC